MNWAGLPLVSVAEEVYGGLSSPYRFFPLVNGRVFWPLLPLGPGAEVEQLQLQAVVTMTLLWPKNLMTCGDVKAQVCLDSGLPFL